MFFLRFLLKANFVIVVVLSILLILSFYKNDESIIFKWALVYQICMMILVFILKLFYNQKEVFKILTALAYVFSYMLFVGWFIGGFPFVMISIFDVLKK